jgi:ABC-type bacteriocin/lantibiotic exporter with double-glycine peptidase domain
MAAEGDISVGDLVAVYGYVAVLVVPVAELIENGSDIARALVSARRVIELLRLGTDPVDTAVDAGGDAPPEPADLFDPESGVEVAVGRFTALACTRPADATTVVDRLGGLRASAATWGGIRLAEIAPAQVRERILVADNEAAIFAGPLRDIVAGRFDLDDQAVANALRTAVAEDIVTALPEGMSSFIASMGRNLSGGQRQRVRLARVLAAEPEILLACEPTSAVDAHTEALIAQEIHAVRSGRTTLVTTTSPLLLDRADIVHYLVDGRVAASGTHHDLLERQPGYRALVSRGLDDEHAVPRQPSAAQSAAEAAP